MGWDVGLIRVDINARKGPDKLLVATYRICCVVKSRPEGSRRGIEGTALDGEGLMFVSPSEQ